jgi:hypothetical protein
LAHVLVGEPDSTSPGNALVLLCTKLSDGPVYKENERLPVSTASLENPHKRWDFEIL